MEVIPTRVVSISCLTNHFMILMASCLAQMASIKREAIMTTSTCIILPREAAIQPKEVKLTTMATMSTSQGPTTTVVTSRSHASTEPIPWRRSKRSTELTTTPITSINATRDLTRKVIIIEIQDLPTKTVELPELMKKMLS